MRLRIGMAFAAVVLVGAMSACSNGRGSASARPSTTQSTPPSTATTPTSISPSAPPSSATLAAVKTFFADHGAPLIAFERATGPLATGSAPTLMIYRRFQEQIFPSISPQGASGLLSLSMQVPDSRLASAFHLDVFNKLGIVSACLASPGLPTGRALDPHALSSLHDNARDLQLLLSNYGVNL